MHTAGVSLVMLASLFFAAHHSQTHSSGRCQRRRVVQGMFPDFVSLLLILMFCYSPLHLFAISIQLSMHFLFPSTFHFFCSHSFPILFPFFFCFCSTLSVNISTLLFPFQSSLFSLIPISLFYSIPLFTISIPPASEERDHQSRRCSPQHPRDPHQEGPPIQTTPKTTPKAGRCTATSQNW